MANNTATAAELFKKPILVPYVPVLVTRTVDGESKSGYLSDDKIVPIEDANEEFWAEVNRRHPPQVLLNRVHFDLTGVQALDKIQELIKDQPEK